MKAYLSAPPLLSPSQPGEEIFLYLAVSLAAVSAALIKEEEKVQKLVYYASRALRRAEERYPPMEKLAFASDGNSQTQAILPSPYGSRLDRQALTASYEQP